MSIHKEVIVHSTSSHHVHPVVKTVTSKERVDTANIHSALNTSSKSSSEREIQKLDTVVSYSLGEHCVIQVLSDHVGLVRGECLIYYVNNQLKSLDDMITVPPGMKEEFQRISSMDPQTEHSVDVQWYRRKDNSAQIIALDVVPEKLGHNCGILPNRVTREDYKLFFESILKDNIVKGSFKSIVLPIPA